MYSKNALLGSCEYSHRAIIGREESSRFLGGGELRSRRERERDPVRGRNRTCVCVWTVYSAKLENADLLGAACHPRGIYFAIPRNSHSRSVVYAASRVLSAAFDLVLSVSASVGCPRLLVDTVPFNG